MPLNDNQFNAMQLWLRNYEELRNRLDFIWDNLNAPQKVGLVSEVKSNLDAEFEASLAAVSGSQSAITGPL